MTRIAATVVGVLLAVRPAVGQTMTVQATAVNPACRTLSGLVQLIQLGPDRVLTTHAIPTLQDHQNDGVAESFGCFSIAHGATATADAKERTTNLMFMPIGAIPVARFTLTSGRGAGMLFYSPIGFPFAGWKCIRNCPMKE